MQCLLPMQGLCVHSDPTGLQEKTCQQSFCLVVLALGIYRHLSKNLKQVLLA